MKTGIAALATLSILLLLTGCTDDPPSVHVTNLRATKANVQFKQANGNTINQNDVAAGTSSNFQDVTEGSVVVTAGIQNESVSPTATFNASNENNYTVVILGGNPPTLRVDAAGK